MYILLTLLYNNCQSLEYYLLCICLSRGAPKRGSCRAAALTEPPKPKFKRHRFCRYDDIKYFTLFTLQQNQPLKLADE
jgi:hypothetical protein